LVRGAFYLLLLMAVGVIPFALAQRAATKSVATGDKDLVIAGRVSALSLSPADAPFTFGNTGSLNTARQDPTATLLPNGKVLGDGGVGTSGYLTSAELYDPASGTWTATGSLATARSEHTATLLPNGRVLVSGGSSTSSLLASAELYDPASGTWAATGSLHTARSEHTAALLPNGEVLVAGGWNGPSLVSAELYDPKSGTWATTGSLATARR